MKDKDSFINKLRSSNLRLTDQRIQICKALFDRNTTFHFTIKELHKCLLDKFTNKVALATVYNTVQALKDNGYLKEISINSDKTYFDTNVSNHHHFFDLNKKELIDLKDSDVCKVKIKKTLSGKKIQSIEVLVKVANSN